MTNMTKNISCRFLKTTTTKQKEENISIIQNKNHQTTEGKTKRKREGQRRNIKSMGNKV